MNIWLVLASPRLTSIRVGPLPLAAGLAAPRGVAPGILTIVLQGPEGVFSPPPQAASRSTHTPINIPDVFRIWPSRAADLSVVW
jgi:hypothetical protein